MTFGEKEKKPGVEIFLTYVKALAEGVKTCEASELYPTCTLTSEAATALYVNDNRGQKSPG